MKLSRRQFLKVALATVAVVTPVFAKVKPPEVDEYMEGVNTVSFTVDGLCVGDKVLVQSSVPDGGGLYTVTEVNKGAVAVATRITNNKYTGFEDKPKKKEPYYRQLENRRGKW